MKVKANFKFKVHKDTKENLTWEQAKIYCDSLGDGWRMPTRVELLLMYGNKEEIGGFVNRYYWSSTEYDNNFAWRQHFLTGYQSSDSKLNGPDLVRAVKDLENE